MNAMMPIRRGAAFASIALGFIALSAEQARAGDILTIKIPRHSELTPVQRLNREGVNAVKKMDYGKASALFYKAYLYDPSDPFTLNNLGYVSELQGELDRAQKFYALASQQGCDATIDVSNAKQLQGKPMQYALASLQSTSMRVNRMNIDAMELLEQGRGFEAAALLHQALTLDPQNPFTLNNLGVADEAIGDFDNALGFYDEAARARSSERAVVTMDSAWKGKPVSAMAGASAKRLQERMNRIGGDEEQAVILTVRGVSATNENDWQAARQDFLHAYSLDPNSAFSLNNRGFVAEMDGDLETAEFFYSKARRARNANARVGLATKHAAEGKNLEAVASDSDDHVGGELERYSQERRGQSGPIELTPRGNASGGESSTPEDNSLPADVSPAAAPSVPQLQ
jgi:Flp pilus assembly protein TadD